MKNKVDNFEFLGYTRRMPLCQAADVWHVQWPNAHLLSEYIDLKPMSTIFQHCSLFYHYFSA